MHCCDLCTAPFQHHDRCSSPRAHRATRHHNSQRKPSRPLYTVKSCATSRLTTQAACAQVPYVAASRAAQVPASASADEEEGDSESGSEDADAAPEGAKPKRVELQHVPAARGEC